MGENHPHCTTSLNNLASLYREIGDLAAALALYRRALEIDRVSLGKNHPEYASGLRNLARLHREMGNYAAALPLCRQELEIVRTAASWASPIRTMPPASTTWRCCTKNWGSILPLYHSIAKPWRLSARRTGRRIPTTPPVWTIWRGCTAKWGTTPPLFRSAATHWRSDARR